MGGSQQKASSSCSKEVKIGSYFLMAKKTSKEGDDDDLSSLSGYESGYEASEGSLDEVLKSEEMGPPSLPRNTGTV